MNGAVKLALIGGVAWVAYEWLKPSTAAASAPGSTTTALVPSSPGSTPGKPGPSADALYQQMVQAAKGSGDPAVQVSGGTVTAYDSSGQKKGWDIWNWYLQQASGYSGLPDDVDAGFPVTTGPVTSAQYWAAMAPWLRQNKGLSGLGIFGGLGSIAFGAGRPVQ